MFLSRWLLTNINSFITRLIFLRFFLLSLLLSECLCQYGTTVDYYGSGAGTSDYYGYGSGAGTSDYPTPTNNPPVVVTNPPPQTTLQPASSSLSGIFSFKITDKIYGVIVPFHCSSRAYSASPDHPPVSHSVSWDWRQPFLWLWLRLRARHPECSSLVWAAESPGRIQFLSAASLLYWGQLF